jgi:indolepyruvate ferredoxin oxidoreductase
VIFDKDYQLTDRYALTQGRAFMTGIQALVRLPLMQRQLDQRDGLNTAGFISGYRGSPLGAYDQELWRSKKFLASHDVHFEPGVNEDLGATAVWGTQLTDYYRDQVNKDGVFSIWYGKGHGVDRTADVFRQANVQGTARHGGVLALAGDDHTAESSMFPHQTDQVFEAAIMPILFPTSVEEYLTMGLAGIALSRYCGLWVAFKTITETVESGASIMIPELPKFVMPEDFVMPPHGLNYDVNLKWPAERMEYERRMIEERAPAAHAFVYANKIDKVILKSEQRRFGIVTVGKAHGDLLESFRILGISERDLQDAGISIYKVGMSWPLEPRGIREFAEGMESLLVVEEKRPQLEKQIKEQLYNWPAAKRPAIFGKRDEQGEVLLPEVWAFTPEIVSAALSRWLKGTEIGGFIGKKVSEFVAPCKVQGKNLLAREPYFCSGCPHNTSTQVPDGSTGGAGIGCHIMTISMDRKTKTFTHMGGEGIHWVGLHRFSKNKHMFQNLGDGTYQHSGLMAIRQAVASDVNITYKILYNDAVAMTGGQPAEGEPSPGSIAQQLLAEGVKKVALVSDDIGKFENDSSIPANVTRFDRDELDAVQRQMRDIEGVTAIIYEQTCAAEKRRRRKKGLMEDPNRRLFINDRVCEGCGDCSVQSNCISIEPKETDFGRKRQINQSACNKDYSCVKGFCPSFVSVVGGELRKPDQAQVKTLEAEVFAELPEPTPPELTGNYAVLVSGIGGTGVLTIGALLSMAAHLEGKGSTTLDFTGLSQKNGAVVAHIKLAPTPGDIHVPRILDGGANLLLGCDMVAATASVPKLRQGVSRSIINTAEVPVAAFTRNNDLFFPAQETKDEFSTAIGSEAVDYIDATGIAEAMFGDSIATNLFMVGFAWQKGLLPLSRAAIERAIELNGVAVEFNLRAFRWGRLAAEDLPRVQRLIDERNGEGETQVVALDTLEQKVDRFYRELVEYQDSGYADRYWALVQWVREQEKARLGAAGALSTLVARYFYKLMAYKDEYEVARLYSSPEFEQKLRAQFDGDFKLQFHLAPPLLARRDKVTGKPKKMTFGGWVLPVFRLLAKAKGLRGSALDVFGYTAERRGERQLIEDYEALVRDVMLRVEAGNVDQVERLLALPEQVRGYGRVKKANLEKVRAEWELGVKALDCVAGEVTKAA